MLDVNKKVDIEDIVATLEQAIEAYLLWMESNGYTQSTQKNYRSQLNQFLSFVKSGRYCWDEIFTLSTFKRFNQIKRSANAVTGLSRYLYEQGKIAQPLRSQKTSTPLPTVFEDYLCYRRKYHQTPKPTIRKSQRVLGAFARYLKQHSIKLQGLRIEQIDAFLADFFKDFSTATCHAYRGHLRGFLSYLFYERRLVSKDLAPLVTGPPLFAQSKPPKFLRKDEVEKLFAQLRYTTASELRTAAIIHLAFMLGLRPCEIGSLQLDDINFGKEQVCLRHRKNNRPDKLPLPEPAIKAIAAYLIGGRAESRHRTLFLTLHPPYRPLSANLVGVCISNCMKAAGLEASAYWLRHTYAQNLLEAGSSIYEVKEMLGHDSIESTRKYLHIHTEQMRKVLFDETL
jgi:site-specific recombinase XerD